MPNRRVNSTDRNMTFDVLILGCGFTGARVARELVRRNLRVLCTTRSGRAPEGCVALPLDATQPDSLSALARLVSPGMRMVHSVPLVESVSGLADLTPGILAAVRESRPQRVIYISTTGVYGGTRDVDEHTQPAPRTPREFLRVEAENAVAAGDWSSLVLRPAAIYGPGRGVQESVRAGSFRVPEDGGGVISRIHADDLATHVLAGLFSAVTGAFPVADDYPCPSLEAATFAAESLHLPLPMALPRDRLPETLRGDRRVDGRAIRRQLDIELRFPTYREGIRQSLSGNA